MMASYTHHVTMACMALTEKPIYYYKAISIVLAAVMPVFTRAISR